MKYWSVVVWDDSLSKMIGRPPPVESASPLSEEGEQGADEADADDSNDQDDDSEAEPDVPAGNGQLSNSLDFKYNPHDPAGLRMGQLSADDAARYHLIKSACMKAGRLEEWKQALNSSIVELSSSISAQNLTNARSKAAAKAMHEELQRYVCHITLFQHQLTENALCTG